MELTKEQQEKWDEEYIKNLTMAKLVGDYDFYQEISFDAYRAYDYLSRSYKLNEKDAWWTIKNRDRIILHVDEYQDNYQHDLLLRKEYIENRIKIPRMGLFSKTFCGLMHLAKVIGYAPDNFNWNGSEKIIVAGIFPLNRYRSLFVFIMDAREDIKECYLSS